MYGSQSGEYEAHCLLGYDNVYPGKIIIDVLDKSAASSTE
jgi:hypothetical protein